MYTDRRDDRSGMPGVTSLFLFLMGAGFFAGGVYYLHESMLGKREQQITLFDEAVFAWADFRPRFAQVRYNLTVVVTYNNSHSHHHHHFSNGSDVLRDGNATVTSTTEEPKAVTSATPTPTSTSTSTSTYTTGTTVYDIGLLNAINTSDPIYDDEGHQAADIAAYMPLKYGDTVEEFDELYHFKTTPLIQLRFQATEGNVVSYFQTGYLPATRIWQVYGQQPAPDQKCIATGGVYDFKSRMCWLYQKAQGVCLQVEADDVGRWSLSHASAREDGQGGQTDKGGEGNGSGGGGGDGSGGGSDSGSVDDDVVDGAGQERNPNPDSHIVYGDYGCDPKNDWSPLTFESLSVEGHSTLDVIVPEVDLSPFRVLIRSTLDPFLHLEMVTDSTNTFSLSWTSALTVGCIFIFLSLLLCINPFFVLKRICSPEGDARPYGQLRAADGMRRDNKRGSFYGDGVGIRRFSFNTNGGRGGGGGGGGEDEYYDEDYYLDDDEDGDNDYGGDGGRRGSGNSDDHLDQGGGGGGRVRMFSRPNALAAAGGGGGGGGGGGAGRGEVELPERNLV